MHDIGSTLVVIYDGDCAFCTGVAAWVQRHDRQSRIDLRPITAVSDVRGHHFEREDLEREMHAVNARGNVHRGFAAWRAIVRELPLLRPLSPLLGVPGVSFVGVRVYAWVAGHRTVISRWLRLDHGAACGVAGSAGACDRR